MKRKIDWLQFGQFLTMLVELWTIIKEEFKKRNVGPEVLEYIRGPGKVKFKFFLGEISVEYLQWAEKQKPAGLAKLQPLIAEVDLDLNPVAPFKSAGLTKHIRQGKVRFEYRPDEDELYVNGKKFMPWLSPEQSSGGVIKGTHLEPEANKHGSLNATAADFLFENPSFIPMKYRKGSLFFWASEWEDPSDGYRYVRYLFWNGGRWFRVYYWLGHDWGARGPSASLAS